MKLAEQILSRLSESEDTIIKGFIKNLKKESREKPTLDDMAWLIVAGTDIQDYQWREIERPVLNSVSKAATGKIVKIAKDLAKKFNINPIHLQMDKNKIDNSDQLNDAIQLGDTLGIDVLFDIGYGLPLVKKDIQSKGLLKEFSSELKKIRKELKDLGLELHNDFHDKKQIKLEKFWKRILKQF